MTGPLPALNPDANSDTDTQLQIPSPRCQQCNQNPVSGPKTNLCQCCQAEIPTYDQNGKSTPKDEFALLASPYRPFPLEAKNKLRECVNTVVFDTGPDEHDEVAYVTDVPPENLREQFELSVPRDPEERWKDNNGSCIHIYPDRVVADGVETSLEPADAQDRVRSTDRFTRVQK